MSLVHTIFVIQGLLRDGYLKEMIQVLSDPRYGSNLTQVEATVKKHEAICADILSRVRVCSILLLPIRHSHVGVFLLFL